MSFLKSRRELEIRELRDRLETLEYDLNNTKKMSEIREGIRRKKEIVFRAYGLTFPPYSIVEMTEDIPYQDIECGDRYVILDNVKEEYMSIQSKTGAMLFFTQSQCRLCGDNTIEENERGKIMNELELKLNLENLIESGRKTLTNLCEKANKPKSKVWKPSVADIYWFATERVLWTEWCDNSVDNFRFRTNNCFKTREEAEFYREKILVQAELERFALENNTEEINWNNYSQCKSFIRYEIDGTVSVLSSPYFPNSGTVCFTSEDVANQVIKEIGEDRIKKYLFGIKQGKR